MEQTYAGVVILVQQVGAVVDSVCMRMRPMHNAYTFC